MKTQYAVAIAMLAGVAVGAIGVQSLHAQATPKAYVISEIEIVDQAAQTAYVPKVVEVIKSTGGTYLAQGGKVASFEGEAPKRVTVVVYDSFEKAQASRTSDAWKALKPERDKAIKATSYAVEALPN
jgi:uncharacterized protein (DUF1330 family)